MRKQFILNTALSGKAAKTILSLEVDSEGIPIASYWRNRFKDALIDNCVELVVAEKIVSQKQVKLRSVEIEKREDVRKKVVKDVSRDSD